MTVRGADYKRKKFDHYETPLLAVDVLFEHIELTAPIFDPACGRRRNIIVAAELLGFRADGQDIVNGEDFLARTAAIKGDVVANPPYDYDGGRGGKLALHFIEHSLELTKRHRRRVCMLLPADFDSAKTRKHVFEDCPQFAVKLTLQNRIRWFNGKAGSTNHAWFVWDWQHRGPPVIKYGLIDYENEDRPARGR